MKVLLLEAGGSDWHPLFHMPAGFAKMTKGIASWGWSTVPQQHLNGRVLWYTQAKVIGGGSSINAQVYTRGNQADYDAWADCIHPDDREAATAASNWSFSVTGFSTLPLIFNGSQSRRFSSRAIRMSYMVKIWRMPQ